MSDIIDRLQHSADMQYRMSGSADEMLHDAISEIRKLRAEMPVAKSLESAVTCLTIERDEARRVVAGQAREIADLRVYVQRLHKEHEVACMGGELLRDEIKRLLAVEAAHKQLRATLNSAGFVVVEGEGGR